MFFFPSKRAEILLSEPLRLKRKLLSVQSREQKKKVQNVIFFLKNEAQNLTF